MRRFWIWKNKCITEINNNQPDIDKTYLYSKDPYEGKYQYLIDKRKSTGLKYFNAHKSFIEYLNDMQDVYKKFMNTIKNIKY